jgi:hypothetical protein
MSNNDWGDRLGACPRRGLRGPFLILPGPDVLGFNCGDCNVRVTVYVAVVHFHYNSSQRLLLLYRPSPSFAISKHLLVLFFNRIHSGQPPFSNDVLSSILYSAPVPIAYVTEPNRMPVRHHTAAHIQANSTITT